MNLDNFRESIYEMIVSTSTDLPKDVRRAVKRATMNESAGTRALLSLETIGQNIAMAESKMSPICQDTGMPTFKLRCPVGVNQIELKEAIHEMVIKATDKGILRPNSVDSLTGENKGNIGPGTPIIKFEQWEEDVIECKLILKGGGCENKNIQYSLPCELEGVGRAGRDLDGIRKCLLHAVYQAQGQGCGPGFIGVGIGGDCSSGYELAKEQLFRHMDDVNPNETLAKLEDYIMANANKLGIGTMGFGGETTLLGCKIAAANRLPASFFVSVAYNCWAFRRAEVRMDAHTGRIDEWSYADGDKTLFANGRKEESDGFEKADGVMVPSEVKHLVAPLSEEAVRALKVGDVVQIDGMLYTGRDAIHKHLSTHECQVDLNGQIIYHCGPVVMKDQHGQWKITAAGPTTSMREEPYQGDVMKKFGVRAVVGKGGMGAKTLKAFEEHGGVYLNAIGGAAQFYAAAIQSVKAVDYMEFGIPEAMWHLQVKGFTAIVTMDAHGNSLHEDVEKTSLEKLSQFKDRVF